ncbi:hypothetical protein A0O34_09030 [Chryseobacterium glaciei]|uniref:Uncharacterized protein n=2 Tax=Chryseobacterium glaciei TaxID=1685010 RepID=A0A172XUL3_9FLAO|nr:hypothetical protein A0O34_09030 [Chryseobacterium glaciei]
MRIILIFFVFLFLSCKTEKKEISKFQKIIIDGSLVDNDTIKLLSKYPELKLFNSEKENSKTRTAYVLETANYYDSGLLRTIHFEDYKCKAEYKQDTLNIWLNNNNGYFGNGVLVKVFNGQFLIKDIDPKTLKGEIKFINSKPFYQKLVLNKDIFQKNDSIYGFIDYKTDVDSLVKKNFRGYFKTSIN